MSNAPDTDNIGRFHCCPAGCDGPLVAKAKMRNGRIVGTSFGCRACGWESNPPPRTDPLTPSEWEVLTRRDDWMAIQREMHSTLPDGTRLPHTQVYRDGVVEIYHDDVPVLIGSYRVEE